ncbi:MAG: sulfotransferase family protein [Deltaproteobacteria bacterium]|jgi:hypothetical protein|nr:sulfotransferase family protein [Deltaproteobacteria bacterium]
MRVDSASNSPSVPAIFMHIQKTAGTALIAPIRAYYGYDNSSSHADHFYDLDELTLVNKFFQNKEMVARYKNMGFISGHFGFDFYRRFMEGRYSFTFLRDPIERILSYYYFCKGREADEYFEYGLAQRLSLDDFLLQGFENPAMRIRIWNNQTWALAYGNWAHTPRPQTSFSPEELLDLALEHLDNFSHIGLLESFQTDRNIILSALGIPLPADNAHINATPGRPGVADLPPATLKLLADLTKLDQRLYDIVLRKRAYSIKNTDYAKVHAQNIVLQNAAFPGSLPRQAKQPDHS